MDKLHTTPLESAWPIEGTVESLPHGEAKLSKKYSTRMTRDQRVRCQALHEAGHSSKDIATRYGLTVRQVQFAMKSPVEPRHSTGRKPIISAAQVEELIAYITESEAHRRMPVSRLAEELGFQGIGEKAMRNALRRAGYEGYLIPLRKPPINKKVRKRKEASTSMTTPPNVQEKHRVSA